MTRLPTRQVALSFRAQARNLTVEAKITHVVLCDPSCCGRSLTSVRDDKSKKIERIGAFTISAIQRLRKQRILPSATRKRQNTTSRVAETKSENVVGAVFAAHER